MNILCKIFGHQPPSCSPLQGGDYVRIATSITDGIGREHAWLKGECPRCGQEYHVGKVHLPQPDPSK